MTMTDAGRHLRMSELVRPDEGLVDRRIFSDEDVYQQELEQIFARCWLFLCHESQIPTPGDYFTTTMGEDPVVAVRQKDGSIAAFLNSCRHRGMKVCRADMGSTRAFTCTYHGWAYALDGSLINVPELDGGYCGELDMSQWGLVQVPQLDVYKGLVFATWDPSAPPLLDYLGDMAWYLDAMYDRVPAGSEVIAGVDKWIFKGNWKFAAEQFCSDMYHTTTSHVSALMALAPKEDENAAAADEDNPAVSPLGGRQFSSPNGHGTGFFTDYGQLFRSTTHPRVRQYFEERWDEIHRHLGDARAKGPIAAHATVFPNFSYLPLTNSLRVWHPRGPHQMEVFAWILVDRDAPPEVKDAQRLFTQLTFSVGGLFEQDDGENWSEIQKTLRGAVQRRYQFNYQMGLGHARDDDPDYPGRTSYVMSEEAARGFYRRYAQLMEADEFPTSPPPVR
jgi:phenylpropionate dioxygenase-like ring-hydroxylating dioxygenase large terminal subunit